MFWNLIGVASSAIARELRRELAKLVIKFNMFCSGGYGIRDAGRSEQRGSQIGHAQSSMLDGIARAGAEIQR